MTTLEQEIQNQEEKALVYKSMGNKYSMNPSEEKQFRALECYQMSAHHRQLAEWLKELKHYRERILYEAGYDDAKRDIILSGKYERAYRRGYEEAMEYCINKLSVLNKEMEVNTDADKEDNK